MYLYGLYLFKNKFNPKRGSYLVNSNVENNIITATIRFSIDFRILRKFITVINNDTDTYGKPVACASQMKYKWDLVVRGHTTGRFSWTGRMCFQI